MDFVDNGSDLATMEYLAKSNRDGLVQKEVTVQGKNGKTFTRKQWVKASDDTSTGTGNPNLDTITENIATMDAKAIENTKAYKAIKDKIASMPDGDKVSDSAIRQAAKTALIVANGQSDTQRMGLMESSTRSRNYVPGQYKAEASLIPKAIRSLGLKVHVVDTSTHDSGYMGVRGQRVYASTYRHKDILVYKAEDNKKPFDDTNYEEDDVLFIRNGKKQHGIIVKTSSDYKPGVALVEVDNGGIKPKLQEVSLNEIKGTYRVRRRGFNDAPIASRYSRSSDADKADMEANVEKLPAPKPKAQPKTNTKPKSDTKQPAAKPAASLGTGSKDDIAAALAKGATRQQLMDAAKAAGITWKHNDHEGINWMRASMAIQKAGKEGKLG